MKLTNADREAFVRAVMDDVPMIAYDDQAQKLCEQWAKDRMPADVAALYKTKPEWVNREYVRTPSGLSNYLLPVERGTGLDAEVYEKLEELARLRNEQQKKRWEIKCKLDGVIKGCSTLKQAKDRLPEFEKYLPQERDSKIITTLPAIANVVADLTNAGWPKSEKK